MKPEIVKHVAKLARLKLTEEEINRFSKELAEIEKAFSKIKEVDTDKIEPTFQPIEMKNVMREDSPEKSLSQEEALANAGHKEKGFFKGPKVV